MAYALVGSVGTVATGTTSASPTFAQATTAGNLLVAWVVYNGSTPITSTQSWVFANSDSTAAQVWYKANCAAGETAPVFSRTGVTFMAAALAEFSGGATSSPVDRKLASSSGTTPLSLTTLGADIAAGELVLGSQKDLLTKSGTVTTSHTYNNGATATANLNNDATSTADHYRFSYGITTGNSAADNISMADNSMNLSGINGTIISFLLFTASTRTPRNPAIDLIDPAFV